MPPLGRLLTVGVEVILLSFIHQFGLPRQNYLEKTVVMLDLNQYFEIVKRVMGEELKTFFSRFVELEEGAWDAFSEILTPRVLKRKEHFLTQGEICKKLGFIARGSVRVYFMVETEEITKDFNFENSFCGSYASFSLQQPSRFNVVAMEETTLYTIGREDLYRLFDKYSSIQKIGRLSIENMFIRKELREASFLLDSAQKRYESLLAQDPGIVNRVPLKYLASYIGVKAETLSRIRGNR